MAPQEVIKPNLQRLHGKITLADQNLDSQITSNHLIPHQPPPDNTLAIRFCGLPLKWISLHRPQACHLLSDRILTAAEDI